MRNFSFYLAGLFILWTLCLSGCDMSVETEASSTSSDSKQLQVKTVAYGESKADSSSPAVTYEEISPIISMSCMPCHNRHTIGTVIERLEKTNLETLDGETKARVLAEITELRQYMEDGVPVSFTSEAEIQKFLKAAPGEFYTMLQKGVMPPGFAPELMQHIQFNEYKALTWENRIKLLNYAKPYSKAYMR